MTLLSQLIKVYKQLHKDTLALSDIEAERYYTKMVNDGRIEYVLQNDELVGFLESWRLTYEQAGRVLCWKDFNAVEENVKDGGIIFLVDIWVKEGYRDGTINKVLINAYKEANKDVHSGFSKRHNGKYIRVYNKENFYKLKEGEL